MSNAFTLNGNLVSFEKDQASMPLLWFLREEAGLKGAKFGCGIGQCGACTVHMNGAAVRACSLPMAQVAGSDITTIEGLAYDEQSLHPVQQAWVEVDVPQCGYCQAGQIMAAAALLAQHPTPDASQVEASMTNICRCGTYVRIRKAISLAADKLASEVT